MSWQHPYASERLGIAVALIFLAVGGSRARRGSERFPSRPTVSPLARRLGLEAPEPPTPDAMLEIESRQPLNGELLSFYIDEALPVAGERLADVPFPEGTAVTLIVRGREVITPKGSTVLTPGDHDYVYARHEDRPLIQLVLGRPEQR